MTEASTIKIALFIVFQFFFPGSGFAVLKQYRRSAINLGLLFLIVAFFFWTRQVLNPIGLKYFLVAILVAHIALTIWFISAWQRSSRKSFSIFKSLPALAIFLCLSLSLFSIGFLTKHHWLGVHLYFVPSASMQPALQPGDFILVDTWYYRQAKPSEGNIVVFKLPSNNETAVKRIHHWPSGELVKEGNYYALGDNRHHSADSRWFGGIPPDSIRGKVAVIVISIDGHLRIKHGRWLQAVH